MKPCTKALYVSLMSRCDSAAIVPNTSELLPEPDTPVNTVSRRLGRSTLTSLRLFTRAPCTRIRSWRSAAGNVGVAVLIAPPATWGAARRLLGFCSGSTFVEVSDMDPDPWDQLDAAWSERFEGLAEVLDKVVALQQELVNALGELQADLFSLPPAGSKPQ